MSLYKIVKDNFIDTTAKIIVTNPALGFLENIVLGFPDDLTLSSRLTGTIGKYLGAGLAYAAGRRYLHRKLKVDPKKAVGKVFDAAYGGAFFTVFAAGVLAINGATPEEISYGSILSGVTGIAIGTPVGYSLDVFRDLLGQGTSERTPNWINSFGRKTKLGIAASSLALSLGLVGGMIAATPDDFRGVKGYLEDAVYDVTHSSS